MQTRAVLLQETLTALVKTALTEVAVTACSSHMNTDKEICASLYLTVVALNFLSL